MSEETLVVRLPIKKIKPNPNQPRKYFDRLALTELARSVKRNGIIHPVTVRPHGGAYELISGERRVRAAILAGMRTVPAIVVSADEETSAVFALLENLHREDLSFFEIAEGYKSLLERTKLSRSELAHRLGKNTSSVAGKMRLLRLPHKIRQLIRDLRLSESYATELVAVDDEKKQLEILDAVRDMKLGEEQMREYIDDSGAVTKKRRHRDIAGFSSELRGAVNKVKRCGVNASMRECEFEDVTEYVITVRK